MFLCQRENIYVLLYCVLFEYAPFHRIIFKTTCGFRESLWVHPEGYYVLEQTDNIDAVDSTAERKYTLNPLSTWFSRKVIRNV